MCLVGMQEVTAMVSRCWVLEVDILSGAGEIGTCRYLR